jgi:hypothetical protein
VKPSGEVCRLEESTRVVRFVAGIIGVFVPGRPQARRGEDSAFGMILEAEPEARPDPADPDAPRTAPLPLCRCEVAADPFPSVSITRSQRLGLTRGVSRSHTPSGPVRGNGRAAQSTFDTWPKVPDQTPATPLRRTATMPTSAPNRRDTQAADHSTPPPVPVEPLRADEGQPDVPCRRSPRTVRPSTSDIPPRHSEECHPE